MLLFILMMSLEAHCENILQVKKKKKKRKKEGKKKKKERKDVVNFPRVGPKPLETEIYLLNKQETTNKQKNTPPKKQQQQQQQQQKKQFGLLKKHTLLQ